MRGSAGDGDGDGDGSDGDGGPVHEDDEDATERPPPKDPPRETSAAPDAGSAPAPLDPDAVLADCDVEFVRAGGPGGQHRNRRETGVRITHRPTGIVVLATERRSQAQNRSLALERLVARLEARRRPRKRRKPTRKGHGVLRREREARQREKARRATRRPVAPPED